MGRLLLRQVGRLVGWQVGSSVTELLGALRRFFLGGGPVTPLSMDIYFKNLISITFTDSLGAP